MGRVAQRPYAKRIMKRVDTAVKRGIREYGYVVHDAMKDAFNASIDEFYKSYTPTNKYEGRYLVGFNKDGSLRYRKFKYWRRRKSLYQALKTNKHNDVKFKKDGDIFGFSSTIRFSGKNIKVKHHNERQGYHNANEWIFNRAYFYGIHGFTKKENESWFKNNHLNYLGKENKWHHNIIEEKIKYNYGVSGMGAAERTPTIVRDNLKESSIPKNILEDNFDAGKYSGYAGVRHDYIKEIKRNIRKNEPIGESKLRIIDVIKKYL